MKENKDTKGQGWQGEGCPGQWFPKRTLGFLEVKCPTLSARIHEVLFPLQHRNNFPFSLCWDLP